MILLPKFSKRERLLLILTVLIVSTTISYVFVIEPVVNTFARINSRIETGLLKLQRSQRLLRKKEIIEAEYKKYADYIKPITSDEEELASMLKDIEAIARSNNISITNIRPQPAVKRDFYDEFKFEVIAEAMPASIFKFIYDLQTSGDLLRVHKITISASSTKRNIIKAIMEITKPAFKSLIMD